MTRSASRIAVLVLAHRLDSLPYLLDLLDDRFALFVHLDAKTERPAGGLRLPAHARLVEPARTIFWGGWTMMEATLDLLLAARSAGPFDRYVLVSGDTLPAVPLDALAATLRDDPRDFVDLVPVPDDPSLAGLPMLEGTARHGWVQPWRFQNATCWDHALLNPFLRKAAAAQYGLSQDTTDWLRGDVERLVQGVVRRLHPPRRRLFATFWYGAQWWGLRGETVEAILPALLDPYVQDFFRFMEVPDEHMIHTVIGNADFATAPGPMFTDHPRREAGLFTLDVDGFRTASARGPHILFARKFAPDASPDVAAALRAGRYERDVLGARP